MLSSGILALNLVSCIQALNAVLLSTHLRQAHSGKPEREHTCSHRPGSVTGAGGRADSKQTNQ